MKVYSKVKAVGAAGAIATLIMFVLGLLDVTVTPEIAALVTAVATFIAGYLKWELVGKAGV